MIGFSYYKSDFRQELQYYLVVLRAVNISVEISIHIWLLLVWRDAIECKCNGC